ncbi:MAG: hypothetical protein KAY37_06115 [Phycisphaerae bacterium]|nr:hypothetical protein [Phycisphaerae bacterium]
MATELLHFLTFVTLVSLMVTGCAAHLPAGKARVSRHPLDDQEPANPGPEPEIHFTGLVLRDATKPLDKQLIDFKLNAAKGIPIPPGLPIVSNHDVRIHVRQPDGGEWYEFDVLLGRYLEDDPYTEGKIRTSYASLVLSKGWAYLSGEKPQGETGWGTGSTSGTQWAIHIAVDAKTKQVRHYFYNLEPVNPMPPPQEDRPDIKVEGKWPESPVTVPPGHHMYLTGVPLKASSVTLTPEGNEFVIHVKQRAQAAELECR